MDDRFNQVHLQYMYDSAQARMKAHPDIAEKYQKIIQNYPHFDSKEKAREHVTKNGKGRRFYYWIFAKIGKDEEFYFTQDYFIAVSDADENVEIIKAAEYLGMEMIYSTYYMPE